MSKSYLTDSPTKTKELGKNIAKNVLKKKKGQRAVVFGLEGDLGGGKTTFLQGFALGLSIKDKILSPTFVIMKKYEILKSKEYKNFYHLDCYRASDAKEIFSLGIKEIISNPENIVAVEWAKNIKTVLPEDLIWVKFKFVGQKTRKITF
jgi:tRNA threonylcarbamoyl adenosine modification protein YjeE